MSPVLSDRKNGPCNQRIPSTGREASKAIEWNDNEDAYLTKVLDYTTKYGFGYLMSNGSTGLYFNDDSKLILEP